jgi:hypothetical protein
VSAERFLQLFRQVGGDAYVNARGDVVFDAPAALFSAVRWRIDEHHPRELAHALRDDLALARAQLRARGIEVPVDEHQPTGLY